jgi:hypothetical protein
MRAVLTILLVAVAVPGFAADPIYLRGAEVTRKHAVFGTVRFVGRSTARINLGFAHGLEAYDQLLICRRMGLRIVPISVLTIKKVLPESSTGTFSTSFKVRPRDYAVVAAKDLRLWGPESRLATSSRRQLMRRQNGNRYDSRQFSLGLTKELAYDYSEKERVQKDGIFGSFYLRSQQYKVEVDKETGKPKIDEGPTVEGLTTEEGESELLSAGFIRYLDQVVYEDGPKLKNDEAFDIPLDPRNRYASNAAVARLQRDTLNRSAKRMFGSLFEKQITQPVLK